MAVIETSWLNQPRSEAQCILMEHGVIDVVDASGKIVTLEAREVLALFDFLNGWRGAFTQSLHQIEQAHTLAAEAGCTIAPMKTEGYEHYYQVLWLNGNVFQEVLREGDLLDAVQKLIAHSK
jgi:hypothetical protein